jgi:hypothetical protein
MPGGPLFPLAAPFERSDSRIFTDMQSTEEILTNQRIETPCGSQKDRTGGNDFTEASSICHHLVTKFLYTPLQKSKGGKK